MKQIISINNQITPVYFTSSEQFYLILITEEELALTFASRTFGKEYMTRTTSRSLHWLRRQNIPKLPHQLPFLKMKLLVLRMATIRWKTDTILIIHLVLNIFIMLKCINSLIFLPESKVMSYFY